MNTVKTERDMTSWMTLSWMRLNGPPLSTNPIRLAGTWQQYSKNAMPQEMTMTPNIPHFCMIGRLPKRRWPYQAKVMNVLLNKRSNIA